MWGGQKAVALRGRWEGFRAARRAGGPLATWPRALLSSGKPVAAQEDGEAGVFAKRFEDCDGALRKCDGLRETPAQRARHQVKTVVEHLLPKHYESSVGRTYLDYVKFSMGASVVGTMSSVLSMQSLLFAVGLGEGAIPTAAALNWILKDGLGQLGGVLFASIINQRFDAEPRRWRLKSAAVYDASILLEVLTPWFPGHFLLIASVANIGKNVGWLSASATRAGIHRSFMRVENLADITGKAGSQSIAASVVGTGLGIGISKVVGTSTAAIFPAAFALSLCHVMLTYRALQAVTIHTLNLQRFWLALRPALQYEQTAAGLTVALDHSRVLSPDEVSQQEQFVHLGKLSARRFGHSILVQDARTLAALGATSSARMPLRIGSPLHKAFPRPEALAAAASAAQAAGSRHVLGVAQGELHLLFLADCSAEDQFAALLHACVAHQHVLAGVAPEAAVARAQAATNRAEATALVAALQSRGWDTDYAFFEPWRSRISISA